MIIDSIPTSSHALPQPATEQHSSPALTTDHPHADYITELIEKAGALHQSGVRGAHNSRKAYTADIKLLREWLAEYLHADLPITSTQLALYVTHLQETAKWATINRKLASINRWHRLNRQPLPGANNALKDLLDGVQRKIGIEAKQAKAFDFTQFVAVIDGLAKDPEAGSHDLELRDRALLLLGFAGAFRRSELVAINRRDLAFDNKGLVISGNQSKTNQKGETEQKAFFFGDDLSRCPVRCLQAYLMTLPSQSEDPEAVEPVFVGYRRLFNSARYFRQTRRLSDQAVDRIVKHYFGPTYSAHSLRTTFVTIARINGSDDSAIMHQTKHKSIGMIQRYTRLNSIRVHNAARKLGL